ncbi:MAG: hypothetical protein ABJP79_01000 [Tateyamaria sp.]|uniref:hypothetical protein n=1 Tax=Tateyamaria sp. TaxID=1929288 RepID=UPI00329BBF30
MTASKDFATQIGALAVGSTAFALGDPSGGTLLATPLTALAALGFTLKSGCADKACEKAEAKVLEHLKNHPEYTTEEIERARAILKDAPNIAHLDPKEVTAHIHGKHLEVEMTRLLMAPLGIGADDHNVETIIKTTLIASIAVCKQDTDFRAALTLEMVLETARKQGIELNLTKQIDKTTKETLRTAQDMQGLLTDLVNGKFVTLDAMKALAAEFGEHDAQDQGSLETFLKLRAQEYFALKSEVDNIDDGLIRLSNLKAAAQDAIARVNLDEVEDLLSRVQEVELEEAAKTAELRANNALLRGRVEQAYRILCAAADSFAAVDPLEPARRRIQGTHKAFPMLCGYGMRYGGDGLEKSAALIRQTLTNHLRTQDAWLWAAGQNNLAAALQKQGIRTDGPKGAEFLAQAVAAYCAALEVYTRADHPVQWAMTQNNLGGALQNQGTRTDGPKGADLLAQAVAAYRAALEVYTRADHPVNWATTQNNLGGALQHQGTRTDGPKGADLLAQAVAAYRAALEVRTRADHSVDWAMTQNNLGATLGSQGTRTDGPKGAELLAQAVAAFRAALEVHTRADHPVDWAMTQNNHGAALRNQGTRTDGPKGADLLAQAVAAYRAALEVYTCADHPVRWAMTQNNLANALQGQGTRTDGLKGADLLVQAVAAYRATLKVYTRADHPVDWAMTQKNIALALLARAQRADAQHPRHELAAAQAAVDGALEVFDPEHMSYEHGSATRVRAVIQTALGALGDEAAGA